MTGNDDVGLQDLADQFDQFANEARNRALASQAGQATGWPPGYWYGVAYGFETAAARLRENSKPIGAPRLLNGVVFLAGVNMSLFLVLMIFAGLTFRAVDWFLLLWPWSIVTFLLVSQWIEKRAKQDDSQWLPDDVFPGAAKEDD